MTDYVEWFRYQLKASADGFEWAFSQIPLSFHDQFPPDPEYMGTWSPARHVWHVTEYERCLAIPTMHDWLNGPIEPNENWPDDDEAWSKVKEREFDALISNFRRIRQQQIDLLDQLTGTNWDIPRETLWGPKPLSMVVTKTLQHTYEHGDTLLRMGLWWDEYLK
jgi:hypothetical protein